MDKSNLELFKQALNEAVSNKFDKMADECTEEIVYSDKHKLAMRAIVYGKTDNKRALSPKMRHIIAILIAVALLLTSCGIIFRNEIREIFEEFFVSLTYESNDENDDMIEDVYTLGYLPEGYVLEHDIIATTYTKYKFVNQKDDIIYFEQRPITSAEFVVDSESGYSKIEEIEEHEIYYRYSGTYNYYIWKNDKYTIKLRSTIKLSNEDIILIYDGITTK